jgi:hypothetical protein
VSWSLLLRSGIAVELAEKGRAVFRRQVSQIRNEGFDPLPRRISQVRSTAGIGGISFDQVGIELMLPDQKAEAIAETRIPILMTIVVWGRRGLLRTRWNVGSRFPTEFLNGAKAYAISLPEGAVDSAGLSNSHLCASDERGNIGRIGISETDETFRRRSLVNGGLENPPSDCRVRESVFEVGFDSNTVMALRNSK